MENIITEKELLELEISGVRLAMQDMKDSKTLTDKQKTIMNNLLLKLELRIIEIEREKV